jgi:hypothetical protein
VVNTRGDFAPVICATAAARRRSPGTAYLQPLLVLLGR